MGMFDCFARVGGTTPVEARGLRGLLGVMRAGMSRLVAIMMATSHGLLLAMPAPAGAAVCPNAAARVSASQSLPDCRAYEQVTPASKRADGIPVGLVLFQVQAAPSGESLAYLDLNALPGAAGSELPNGAMASRSSSGWDNTDISPPTPVSPSPGGTLLGYDFSTDLSHFVVKLPLQRLAPNTPENVYNLFLHNPDGSYSLLTSTPPNPAIPANCPYCFETTDVPAFAGASSGYKHVLFEANEALMPGPPAGGIENLYENAEGIVRPVGVLPDHSFSFGSTPGAGIRTLYNASELAAAHNIEGAISTDGSHIVFGAPADGGAPDPEQIGLEQVYDRIDGTSTIELSAPAPGATPANSTAEPSQFWAASPDGSRVFFTSSAELTTASNTGVANAGADLYEYELGTNELRDLTVDSNPLDANTGADVLGVVGTSTDTSDVYFVARGELRPGQGTSGQPNLYLWREGAAQPIFIATLSEADASDWISIPAKREAYTTPDGDHLAFMSTRSLTGYDNTDQSTGNADSEVYEYDATTGALACASCNQNGERPVSSSFIGAAANELISTPFHQPRVLSDDGHRLFFSSADPLVTGSGGLHTRVFEFEGNHDYLISSGSSESDDLFLDASASGNDVFIASRGQLIGSDQDQYADIYDARIDGGFPEAAPVAPCIASACQGPSATPPVFSPPASASLAGVEPLPVHMTTKPKSAKKAKKKKKKKKPAKKRSTRSRASGHKTVKLGRVKATTIRKR